MDAWLVWTIIAAGLAAAETLSLDLVLVMLAGGAAAGAISATFLPPAGQVVVAIAAAVALLLGVRPVARRHLSGFGGHISGSAGLVGKDAVVLSRVDSQEGRVRLNGGEWSARSFDVTQVITAGTTVRVMQIDGATAVVWDAADMR